MSRWVPGWGTLHLLQRLLVTVTVLVAAVLLIQGAVDRDGLALAQGAAILVVSAFMTLTGRWARGGR
jgi:hypothetical protein